MRSSRLRLSAGLAIAAMSASFPSSSAFAADQFQQFQAYCNGRPITQTATGLKCDSAPSSGAAVPSGTGPAAAFQFGAALGSLLNEAAKGSSAAPVVVPAPSPTAGIGGVDLGSLTQRSSVEEQRLAEDEFYRQRSVARQQLCEAQATLSKDNEASPQFRDHLRRLEAAKQNWTTASRGAAYPPCVVVTTPNVVDLSNARTAGVNPDRVNGEEAENRAVAAAKFQYCRLLGLQSPGDGPVMRARFNHAVEVAKELWTWRSHGAPLPSCDNFEHDPDLAEFRESPQNVRQAMFPNKRTGVVGADGRSAGPTIVDLHESTTSVVDPGLVSGNRAPLPAEEPKGRFINPLSEPARYREFLMRENADLKQALADAHDTPTKERLESMLRSNENLMEKSTEP